MPRLILLTKPYGVLSQFTDSASRPTLADYLDSRRVRGGRLDRDSEGLLALTDDGALQARISHPRCKKPKTYLAQVEGDPTEAVFERLRRGIEAQRRPHRPAMVQRIPEPAGLWPRDPPIRYRAAIPTVWLEITLCEGRNRQVRRMTAAIGHPTLRLIRWRIGD